MEKRPDKTKTGRGRRAPRTYRQPTRTPLLRQTLQEGIRSAVVRLARIAHDGDDGREHDEEVERRRAGRDVREALVQDPRALHLGLEDHVHALEVHVLEHDVLQNQGPEGYAPDGREPELVLDLV